MFEDGKDRTRTAALGCARPSRCSLDQTRLAVSRMEGEIKVYGTRSIVSGGTDTSTTSERPFVVSQRMLQHAQEGKMGDIQGL